MSRLTPLLAIATLALIGFGPAAAQEVGDDVTLTGCLAEENDDGEVEFLLENGMLGETTFEEVDLVAGEGVDLAAHVGHTVEVTGVVIADDEGEDQDAEMEEEDAEGEDELSVQVAELGHIASSCEGG